MTKVSEKEILKTPVFTVVEKEIEEAPFKPVGLNCAHWVMVVALDSRSDKTIIVRQSRWGIEKKTIEFPCGTVEGTGENEEIHQCAAAREFREETGIPITALDLQDIGEFNPNPAYFNNKMHVYVYKSKDLMKDYENRLEPELDSTEDCVVDIVDLKKLLNDESFLNNGMTLSALALLARKKLIKF